MVHEMYTEMSTCIYECMLLSWAELVANEKAVPGLPQITIIDRHREGSKPIEMSGKKLMSNLNSSCAT